MMPQSGYRRERFSPGSKNRKPVPRRGALIIGFVNRNRPCRRLGGSPVFFPWPSGGVSPRLRLSLCRKFVFSGRVFPEFSPSW